MAGKSLFQNSKISTCVHCAEAFVILCNRCHVKFAENNQYSVGKVFKFPTMRDRAESIIARAHVYDYAWKTPNGGGARERGCVVGEK